MLNFAFKKDFFVEQQDEYIKVPSGYFSSWSEYIIRTQGNSNCFVEQALFSLKGNIYKTEKMIKQYNQHLTKNKYINLNDGPRFNNNIAYFTVVISNYDTINLNFDWFKIISILDKEFSSEIKKYNLQPTNYEMRSDGTVEYKSLPANVDMDKIYEVLKDMRSEICCCCGGK